MRFYLERLAASAAVIALVVALFVPGALLWSIACGVLAVYLRVDE